MFITEVKHEMRASHLGLITPKLLKSVDYAHMLSLMFYIIATIYTDTDTDTDNCFIVSSGVYKCNIYIFKSWNNQQLKLSYKRTTFTL